jgi:hypothetical protein
MGNGRSVHQVAIGDLNNSSLSTQLYSFDM